MTNAEDKAAEPPPHLSLPGCYKAAFPFRLATTSFIYPDHILPNVEMIAPCVDEVELLLFESRPAESLPDAETIEKLARIGQNQQLSYNVHLPLDIDMCAPEPRQRRQAVDTCHRIFRITRPLAPTSFTLHLPYNENPEDGKAVSRWQQRARQALAMLFDGNVAPGQICIETLSYPPAFLDELLTGFGLAMCIDTGHLVEHGRDPLAVYERYADITPLIHLYGGVVEGRGHVGLDRLPAEQTSAITEILHRFAGTVCLEVFSRKHLVASLAFLEAHVNRV
ncbi:MAG: cobamide remodeling phosphodiesterase CbiR [Thermodesulfobacteriota bacterium]